MKHIGRELLTDLSTKEEFRFAVHCSRCGWVWESAPVRFSRAGVVPATEEKRMIYATLYRQEKESALRKAVEQAEQTFNICPICHRLVCDRCFLICNDLDMCADCAQRLREKGTPVASS